MSTFSVRVAASTDDGDYNAGFDPAWDYNESSINTGKSGFPTNQDLILGVRFNSVTIPNGSTINSAKITFKSSWTDTNNVLTKIYGIDEDDTADFSSDPTGRTKTTAAIDWDLNGVTSGNTYDTSDISTIVKEIVDRVGWSSGNDMGFLIYNDGSGNGVNHSWYSYDGNSSYAALLTIDYTSPVTTTSTSTTTTSTTTTSTSTSTTTTSTSTTTLPPIDDVGIKISVSGHSANDINPNNMLLWSKYPQLQIFKTGQFSKNFVGGDYYVVDHNLGYKPFAMGYMQWYDGVNDTVSDDFRLLDWSIEGATYTHYSKMEITKTQVKFYMNDSLIEKLITLKGYYIIFINPLQNL